MTLDYRKTLNFWENRGKNSGLDELNVTMLRDKLPELARFIDRVERAHLRRVVSIPKDADVLDLGCGSGRMALEFAKQARHVTAVDFSPALLERGKKLAGQQKIDNIDWIQSSAEDFLQEKSYDVIFLGALLQYLTDKDALTTLHNARAMLADGGVLISRDSVLAENATEPPETPADYQVIYRRQADYAVLFAQAGLELTYCSDMYAFPFLAYGYDRLLPPGLKTARPFRLLLSAALRVQQALDPIMRRLPKLNAWLMGKRARVVQKISLCRRKS